MNIICKVCRTPAPNQTHPTTQHLRDQLKQQGWWVAGLQSRCPTCLKAWREERR
ncbi:hypothetical protein [Streptomyces sp. SID4982]|uniref:hypothetical protein n=1 Tax=Streptomyces sp. SID4982 TaxID=2690291 RepID=UPI0013719A8C|nr:hypothetical protein [Streptomyces sp. SID4982]MYS16594.1 hypothetical protein [Streptomyces sp. SID4982]